MLKKTLTVIGQQEANYPLLARVNTLVSDGEINVVSMGLEAVDDGAADPSFVMLANEMKRRRW